MTITEFDVTCPHCGRVNQAHQGKAGTTPKEGDVSICWRCVLPAVYNADLTVRKPTTEEMAEIQANTSYQAMVQATSRLPTPMQAADEVWGHQ